MDVLNSQHATTITKRWQNRVGVIGWAFEYLNCDCFAQQNLCCRAVVAHPMRSSLATGARWSPLCCSHSNLVSTRQLSRCDCNYRLLKFHKVINFLVTSVYLQIYTNTHAHTHIYTHTYLNHLHFMNSRIPLFPAIIATTL